jgi:hypothetical protein
MLPKPHFHVTDANSPLESEGLPYVLDSFEQLAAPDVWERRQNELPYKTRVCVFPSGRGFRGCERIGDKGSDPLSPIRSQLLQPALNVRSIDQSTRIAFVGSVRIARIAGGKLPERLIPNTARTEPPRVAGSIGDTPASNVRIALPA